MIWVKNTYFLHPISKAWKQGVAAREYHIIEEISAQIHITFHDAVVGGLMNASTLSSKKGRLKQSLSAAKAFVADGDHLRVHTHDVIKKSFIRFFIL